MSRSATILQARQRYRSEAPGPFWVQAQRTLRLHPAGARFTDCTCSHIDNPRKAEDFHIANSYAGCVFNVMLTKQASRRLRGMPNDTERTSIGKIDVLAADPFAPNHNVTALRAIDGFRLRESNWRVLFTINTEAKTLTVAAILHRGEAYR